MEFMTYKDESGYKPKGVALKKHLGHAALFNENDKF